MRATPKVIKKYKSTGPKPDPCGKTFLADISSGRCLLIQARRLESPCKKLQLLAPPVKQHPSPTKIFSSRLWYNSVHLGWVPGHVGVERNDCAVELTARDASMPFLRLEPCSGISKVTANTSSTNGPGSNTLRSGEVSFGQAEVLQTYSSAHFTNWLVNLIETRSSMQLL